MRVILHLGAHKTGSTHLQATLRSGDAALAAAGVRLLDPPRLRRPFGLEQIVRQGAAAPGAAALARMLAGAPELAPDRAPDRVPELAPAPAPGRVLLSDENLAGPALQDRAPGILYPLAEARLAAFLGAGGVADVTLALAVRAPADWLVSAWSQRLLAGHYQPFEVFARGHDPARLRWAELLGRLLAVPGVAGCILWRFEAYPAVLPRVLDRLAGLRDGMSPPGAPANPGLSARAAAAIAADPGGDREDRRRRAAAAQRRFPKSLAHPAPAPFAPAVLAAAAAAHAGDLAACAALPGVEMLAP